MCLVLRACVLEGLEDVVDMMLSRADVQRSSKAWNVYCDCALALRQRPEQALAVYLEVSTQWVRVSGSVWWGWPCHSSPRADSPALTGALPPFQGREKGFLPSQLVVDLVVLYLLDIGDVVQAVKCQQDALVRLKLACMPGGRGGPRRPSTMR